MSSFYALPEAIERLESVPDSAQELLHAVILETMYRKQPAARFRDCDQDIAELEKAGLVVRVDDPKMTAVTLSPEMGKVKKKTYTYLTRKYKNAEQFDPDAGGFVSYPKGATFSADLIVRPDGSTILKGWEFPDDDVTALLDKYGCNRCRTLRR